MRIYSISSPDSSGYLYSNDKYVSKAIADLRPDSPVTSVFAEPLKVDWEKKVVAGDVDIVRFASNGSTPVFSNRAKINLEESKFAIGQWIQLDVNDNSFWLFNSSNVLNVLDEESSTFRRLPSGRITSIEKYAFHREKLPHDQLFYVATKPHYLLCTTEFRNHVNDVGWQGFRFKPFWDSEHEPFRINPFPKDIESRPEIYGPKGILSSLEDS